MIENVGDIVEVEVEDNLRDTEVNRQIEQIQNDRSNNKSTMKDSIVKAQKTPTVAARKQKSGSEAAYDVFTSLLNNDGKRISKLNTNSQLEQAGRYKQSTVNDLDAEFFGTDPNLANSQNNRRPSAGKTLVRS